MEIKQLLLKSIAYELRSSHSVIVIVKLCQHLKYYPIVKKEKKVLCSFFVIFGHPMTTDLEGGCYTVFSFVNIKHVSLPLKLTSIETFNKNKQLSLKDKVYL